jgi:hypothetical protein
MKSVVYVGASSWIRTDDLLIANQSLFSRAGISVTTLNRDSLQSGQNVTKCTGALNGFVAVESGFAPNEVIVPGHETAQELLIQSLAFIGTTRRISNDQ